MGKILYIITRSGGWDGCAIQAELWIKILLDQGYKVTLLTGEFEESTHDFYPYNNIDLLIKPQLSLSSQDEIYNMGFEENYVRKDWVKKFLKQKNEIKSQISELFESHDMVFLHNISLRYLVPALWAAIYELSVEHPDKRIISIEPDSPYERRYLLNSYSLEALYMLHHPSIWYQKEKPAIYAMLRNTSKLGIRMLPGPTHLNNTNHVILNSYQYNAHRDIFGIPESHIWKIPDIGVFEDEQDKEKISPDNDFLEYLKENQVSSPKHEITKDDLFFLCPVRPVYRKNIKYFIKVISQLRKYLKEKKGLEPNIFLTITHSKQDEVEYFDMILDVAEILDVTIIYLGESLRLRRIENSDEKPKYTYNEFLNIISKLKSVCFSGSSFGGWENAVVECTSSHIPVFVNPKIPAFGDMIRIGYIYPIIPFVKMVRPEKLSEKKVWEKNYSFELFLERIYSYFYDEQMRKKITEHNYDMGMKFQSIEFLKEDVIIPMLNDNE